MAQRERNRSMTDDELEDLADAAGDLGERLLKALSEETGRPPEEFDVDPEEYEYPAPDSTPARDRADR